MTRPSLGERSSICATLLVHLSSRLAVPIDAFIDAEREKLDPCCSISFSEKGAAGDKRSRRASGGFILFMSIVRLWWVKNRVRGFSLIRRFCLLPTPCCFPSAPAQFLPPPILSQMSSLAALLSIVLFPGFALAQIYAPDCSLTWQWTFNTLGQNACTVAAYLMSTCNGGSFTINSLMPGYSYTGPSGIDDSNLCKCNTVAYSLISACDACQSEQWVSWSEYSFNCTRVLPPSTFPNPVPSGTKVPQWSLLDVTLEDNWNNNKSFAVGDSPEIGPGALIGNPSGSTSTARTGTITAGSPSNTNTGSNSSLPTPSPTGSSSNTGAIAGGVVGGIAAISIAALAMFFYFRRRGTHEPSSTTAVGNSSQPYMGQIQPSLADEETVVPSSLPGTPVTPMKLYDPNDPTTFPGYQPVAQTLGAPMQVPVAPYVGTGNTLANMQISRPQGYHGLPTV
ncbi:hypothetical protein F5148DRAFT_25456 [Russula earlei]|uniref:Uncharacterized protein n=1 Tax=Russula earlei TaxID=71964 RepID=A0ACC0TRF9_9AGAM|nr:hypothetical protein F5148DRAFT_25456 [Russula earlei]